MRFPWTKRKKSRSKAAAPTSDFGPFGDLKDSKVLHHHVVRALCGVLMNRHSDCSYLHPFCGPGAHHKVDDNQVPFIVNAVPQVDPYSTTVIGIYLTRAVAVESTEDEKDIIQYISRMMPAEVMPSGKIVVYPMKNGIYPVAYGAVINTVIGGYATGSIDPATARYFISDPEPSHCQWQYEDSVITPEVPLGTYPILQFHCLQVFGECWVVEINSTRQMTQLVAVVDFADSPEHASEYHTSLLLGDESAFLR